MHREEFIADNMIKVGYAVISASDPSIRWVRVSADWRSADRSYFSDLILSVHTCCTMICLSNCVVARVIDKHHKHP